MPFRNSYFSHVKVFRHFEDFTKLSNNHIFNFVFLIAEIGVAFMWTFTYELIFKVDYSSATTNNAVGRIGHRILEKAFNAGKRF